MYDDEPDIFDIIAITFDDIPDFVKKELEQREVRRLLDLIEIIKILVPPEPPKVRSPRVDRFPDPNIVNRTLVPFVGGPYHKDLRSVESPLLYGYKLPPPLGPVIYSKPTDDDFLILPEMELYYLTRIWCHRATEEYMWVYRHSSLQMEPGASCRELVEAITFAYDSGFRPELQRKKTEYSER